MSVYYELRLSGNLKLSKDKSTAAKLANWFRDVRDKIDNVRYFKFDKTDFELDSGLSNFLRINENDMSELRDLETFNYIRHFDNDYVESPLKKIITEENDIFTIDICIGSKNKWNELSTLVFLLLEFAEDGFKIMLYNETCILVLEKDPKINNWKLSSKAAHKYATWAYCFDDIMRHELKCNTLDEEDEGVGPSCRMFIRDGLEID